MIPTATTVDDTMYAAPLPDQQRPHFRAILRHLALSLLTATIIPSALFSLCLIAGNIWAALIVALVWCYGAMAWRVSRQGRASGLLILTVVGLTAKTAFTFASGSTFVYFMQPALTDTIIAALFLVSLATARPIVARLAADFFPMNADVAGRPRVQRLFWRLTFFWALICLAKAVVTVLLFESLSTVAFVAIKGASITLIILSATAVTVWLAYRVARTEGLLHRNTPAVPLPA